MKHFLWGSEWSGAMAVQQPFVIWTRGASLSNWPNNMKPFVLLFYNTIYSPLLHLAQTQVSK